MLLQSEKLVKSIHHTSFDLDTFKNDTFKKCHFQKNIQTYITRTLHECSRLSKYVKKRCAIPTKCEISHFPINITKCKKCNWLVYLYMYVSRTTILASCWEFFCGFRSGINYHIKKLSANMKLYMLVLKLDGLDSFKNSGKKIRKVRQLIGSKNDKSKLFTY